MIKSVVASHVNNKLEFIGQNIYDMFDDRFSRIEIHLDMKFVGNNTSTSNTIRQCVVRQFQLIMLL